MKNKIFGIIVALTAFVAFALPAKAVNTIPLKADSANAAPCIVYGDPFNNMGCTLFANPSTPVGTGETAALGIYNSTNVPVNASFETLLSSGAGTIIIATPSISTTTVPYGLVGIPDGTMLVLTSTAAAGGGVTFQDNGTLSGSQLELGAATRTVTLNKILRLRFVSATSKWVEESYGNN